MKENNKLFKVTYSIIFTRVSILNTIIYHNKHCTRDRSRKLWFLSGWQLWVKIYRLILILATCRNNWLILPSQNVSSDEQSGIITLKNNKDSWQITFKRVSGQYFFFYKNISLLLDRSEFFLLFLAFKNKNKNSAQDSKSGNW